MSFRAAEQQSSRAAGFKAAALAEPVGKGGAVHICIAHTGSFAPWTMQKVGGINFHAKRLKERLKRLPKKE